VPRVGNSLLNVPALQRQQQWPAAESFWSSRAPPH